MPLKCGIVGLPNVGKSTLFNALAQKNQAEASNYPFCTIEPNVCRVAQEDERIKKLAQLVNPQNIIYEFIEVVDIAGLVKGASKGEGLGNKFLGNIKSVDAIIEMVRCFEDDNIMHVNGKIDPIEDIKTIELELILSDLESAIKMKENLTKKKDSNSSKKIDLLNIFITNFENEIFASQIIEDFSDEDKKITKEFMFLTAKPVIYIANLDENSIANFKENENYIKLQNFLQERIKNLPLEQNLFYNEIIPICAKIEADICTFSQDEKKEFLESVNIQEESLSKIAKAGFKILNYITYFTVGEKEIRAWSIRKNTKAPEAAGVIHSDFEKGFIKAEVIAYEDFINLGSENEVKKAGKMRLEGKDYIVKDSDIMHFKFNT